MYTPYLFLAYAAALMLVLLGFGVVQRSVPNQRGLRWLRRYVTCGLSALILFGLRAHAPSLITILIPNCLLYAGIAFLYLGITEILEIPRYMLTWVAGCCVAASIADAWFTLVHSLELPRLEIHCTALVAVLAICCIPLFRERRPALLYPARACAWLFSVSLALNLGWGFFGLWHHPAPVFLHPDAVDAVASYLVMVLMLAMVASLTWLSFCVHREDLKAEASTDALTGLMNRGAFERILREEMQTGRETLGLILVDVDYFKQVNDSHGHLVGDDVLRRIGATLRTGIRPTDLLARYGGEEFVVLIRGTELETTEEVAERLRAAVEALDDLPRGVSLTASFGVAASKRSESAADLLLRADEALYRSKREGRNLVTVDLGGAVVWPN